MARGDDLMSSKRCNRYNIIDIIYAAILAEVYCKEAGSLCSFIAIEQLANLTKFTALSASALNQQSRSMSVGQV